MPRGLGRGAFSRMGDHAALLAQDGIYRELYEAQFRRGLDVHLPHAPGIDG